jgi:hypothetical protein
MDKHREGRDITTDAEIDAALEGAKAHDNDPLASTVQYVPLPKLLIIVLTNGRRIALPIEGVPELKKATKKVLQNSELLGRGTAIHWPDIDVALPIDGIIEGVYGKSRSMSELGQKSGSAKTSAKRKTAPVSGAKVGRPRKVVDTPKKSAREVTATRVPTGRVAGAKVRPPKKSVVPERRVSGRHP